MKGKIRKWQLSDAKDLAVALSNTKVQDNLRDGLPYPYTKQDFVCRIFIGRPQNSDIT